LWDTILAGKVWRGEVINRRKDGTLYTEEMTITPVIQSDGSLTNFIAIKQDITERKRAEEALAEAHQQALEANRLKTQLLTNVSHDLRTPLGAILGFAEMLRAGVFGEATQKQKEAAGEIIDSSNQLMTFVDNLIGQAQFETGKIVLKVKSFDPRELFAPLQATAGTLAKKKGVQLEYEIDEQLPKVLFGDLYWLRQIVANLINNAVKFTDQGAVKVRLHQPDAQHWAIQVADTGIGIPEEDQAAIFEAFRQVDGSTTRRHGGSGLGLAIVQELTTLMDGKIELNSAIGKGSTFTITLPLIRSEENSA
jgi:signal transduction histidine kinase